MKTVNKILLGAFVMFGVCFTSCDTLDQPYHEGYEDGPFTSAESVRIAAVGMYNLMQNSEFLGGRAQIYADVRSMDTNPSSYFGAVSSMNGSLSSTNSYVNDGWRGGYRTVGEINLFIEKLNAAAEGVVTADEKAAYINEARLLRGVVYFYILNLWGDQYTTSGAGLGVPWIDRPFDGITAFTDAAIVPRSTTAQIYEKIIEDLTAGTALPAKRGKGDATLYFAGSNAAWAMLSRVHLYMENYDAAIAAANKVTGYTLDADPAKNTFVLPPSASKEIIFWIAHNDTDNPNTNNSLGQHYGVNGRADITLSDNYIALFDTEKDIRYKTLIVVKTDSKGNKLYYTNKYPDRSWNWAPVIRYGEVILNEAEARAKQATGVDELAIMLVNRIRIRAGVDLVDANDFADKAALVDFILAERRREIAFEGQGSFDLFRNRKGIPAGRGSSKAAAIPYPSDLFALPIPDRDIIKGKGVIKQNPGY
jgi:tetratricopeptide (TPR) repeat protein